jgi:hypothetical protein
MPNTDSDTSSESEKEEVAVVKQRKFTNSKTDDTENITIDPSLISKIKLNKVQVRQLKRLQAEAVNGEKPIPPINPIKEAKKAEAKIKRDKVKAEKAAIIAEKKRLDKLLEDEAKKIADIKSKYITFKVPVYNKPKYPAKVARVVKEVIAKETEADEADDDETSEEERPKPPRRRRFQKEKVELDTSDEERVAKLESIDKALQSFTFAPRRRTFF